jgi:hypothetical protein
VIGRYRQSAPHQNLLLHEFFMMMVVEVCEFMTKHKLIASAGSHDEVKSQSVVFSFGARRFASKGPRRLFLAQKCLVSPIFEPGINRPKTFLHSHSA